MLTTPLSSQLQSDTPLNLYTVLKRDGGSINPALHSQVRGGWEKKLWGLQF